ncbi:MAG: MXAN_6640 family putative metalloprotease [Ignavibacteriaceae bacterium]
MYNNKAVAMIKYFLITFLTLTIFSSVEAQQLSSTQLDSLYYLVVKNRRPNLLGNNQHLLSIDTTHIKCGFGLINEVKTHLGLFNKQQRDVLQKILDRPVLDTSFVTPNGFFRVHYDTIGVNVPTYSLTDLAIALDSAYNFEINYIGYPPPPSDNGAGGDNRYDIYVTNIGALYGYTEIENEIVPGSSRYTTFMVINNNYSGFYTSGINAARVTVAHEFHHSIQAGNYIYRYNLDEFFYEITSTSMEHFVYPTIKDYYQYLPSYFNYTQNSISTNGGNQEYALAIWNIFQKDRFGYGIIKSEWELMPQMRAMNAINTAIQNYGSSFGSELNKFGVWMNYTNYRTIPGQYFEDAAGYPLVRPVASLDYSATSFPLKLNTGPSSNSFITIVNRANVDTLVTIVTNSDVQNAIDSNSSVYPFQFGLYSQPVNGAVKLTDNYYTTFSADKNAFWLTAEILNGDTIQVGQSLARPVDYAFPSPFNYNKNSFIYIPVTPDQTADVQLYIYTVSMNLVYSTEQKLNYIYGQKVVKWNGRKTDNEKLPSGVYIYITKSGNNISKGKLVIFNE